ncbi:MAG: YicC family protein [Eubacterium sp.]|nr:YicC family protein [Eubacterium sp.]
MVCSMTGFGRSEYLDDEKKIIIEIKSVNHRYCDISVKLPRTISRFEPEIRKRLKLYAERGKIDVFITYQNLKTSETVKYNKEIAGEYMNYLRQIGEDFGLEEDIKPTVLARFPDVFSLEENYSAEDEEYTDIQKVLDEAGKMFLESRQKEGENLAKDLLDKMDEIETLVDRIETLTPQIVEEYREKLTAKVQDILENRDIDETRIVQEVVIYADRVAVDEELVRLRSHIQAVRDILSEDKAVGRKLDFIVQEMNREANTTLSKSDTKEVTDIGIDLKTLIEKVREQVQNLE